MNLEKTTQALLYICPKLKEGGIHHMMKLLYFADKYHVAHFGRTISKDSYFKHKDGPIPSNTYAKIKDGTLIEGNFVCDGSICTPLREPNVEHLSASDLKALDFAIGQYAHQSHEALKKASQDASWQATPDAGTMDFETFILTFDQETQEDLKVYASAE